MAEEPLSVDANDAPPPAGALGKLRAWTAGSTRRNKLVSIALGGIALVTVALWLLLADIAAAPEEASIEQALAALDAGDDEAARSLVARLQQQSPDGDEYGGQLFLMGALKVRHAESQWSPERARTEFYVASRYLSEARSVGFPEGREALGFFLLGESLIESRQYDAGVEAMKRSLAAGHDEAVRARLLLARAHRRAPAARHAAAVDELEAALADPAITAEQRARAVIMLAESLAKIGRYDDADRYAAEAGSVAPPAEANLVAGKALVARLEAVVAGAAADASPTSVSQRAVAVLEKARRLDKLATSVSQQSEYLLGRAAELVGDADAARVRYAELRRKHGSSPPGIVASIAEGDLLRKRGDESAIEAYRRALDSLQEPTGYEGVLLSLAEVRQRLREAHQGYLTNGAFADGLTLANHLTPPIKRTEQLALRAETLRRWGDHLAKRSEQQGQRGRQAARRARLRYREAGVAYEQLAESRYATRRFIDDLLESADAYAGGQSYSDAARVLERYLRNEPQLRNAGALVSLGQARLALGDAQAAIDAFEECLLFHPTDAASYRARLDCAAAYVILDQPERAIEMLNENLMETAMTPSSPEWRDSKFALGRLLVELSRHNEAIDCLSEAVDRYPGDPQSLTARYLMAESHRHASLAPLARLATAKTVNERERARSEANAHLEDALSLYESVQNEITLASSEDDLARATLRNCYMMRASVLFEMGRYDDAIKAYSNVTTLYQNEPFSLVTLVQISHCRRRLQDNVRARGAIEQARLVLARLPPEADFANSTNLTRTEWVRLLDELVLF